MLKSYMFIIQEFSFQKEPKEIMDKITGWRNKRNRLHLTEKKYIVTDCAVIKRLNYRSDTRLALCKVMF